MGLAQPCLRTVMWPFARMPRDFAVLTMALLNSTSARCFPVPGRYNRDAVGQPLAFQATTAM